MTNAPFYAAIPADFQYKATQHIAQIVNDAIMHPDNEATLIVFDTETPLATSLSAAYQQALPHARAVDIASATNDTILADFQALPAGSLVVLIQSTHFRLDAYRLRVQLFNLGLKVIEHVHLARMINAEALIYIESLAYDSTYYRQTGQRLATAINHAPNTRIHSGDNAVLQFEGALETAKLNVGDYRALRNVGGQFPIGEVFTEAQDLTQLNGRACVFVFGDTQFLCNRPETPLTLVIEKGRVVAVENSTPHFDDVLTRIRTCEGEVWVRELGLGLNRAFTPTQTVSDIGTFERLCGVHLSLGAKHGSYNKPQFKRKDTRFHIDVFLLTTAVFFGTQNVFEDGRWLV